MAVSAQLRIGCAGWSIPRDFKDQFPVEGSHLQRYAIRFSAVEINSSFYRPHLPRTYERWNAETPRDFRFSVKFPKLITHQKRLQNVREPMADFLVQSSHLSEKLSCYLIQLPPSLKFDYKVVIKFLQDFRELSNVPAVCEPRHAGWFTSEAMDLLNSFQLGFVQADPAPVPLTQEVPENTFTYIRLHGSPRVYYSAYDDHQLRKIAERIQKARVKSREIWCIFDNTALGAATANALQLQTLLNIAPDST
jgi:Uncharacterized conserved protein